MSKLPKVTLILTQISAHNSDGLKNALGLIEPNIDQNNINSQLKYSTFPRKTNNDELTRADTPEIKSRKYDSNNNNKFNLLVNETKFSEFETKLSSLEQQNQFLIEKLKNNERNFELQLNRIALTNDGERDNRIKIEKFVNMLNEQVSLT